MRADRVQNLSTQAALVGGITSAVQPLQQIFGCAIAAVITENTPGAATAQLATTSAITLTSAASGAGRNATTFKTVVNAPAANPTNTILVVFTGTAGAIVCTVTPNDGTNNTATPVDLTTTDLVTLINTGAATTVSLTDVSSFRILQTATGGNTTIMAHAGNGDNITAVFANGVSGISGSLKLQSSIDNVNFADVSNSVMNITVSGTYFYNVFEIMYPFLRAVWTDTGSDASAKMDIQVFIKGM